MARPSFKSRNFSFREPTLASVMKAAGLTGKVSLVREPVISGTLRDKNDKFNTKPSKVVTLNRTALGAFGKEKETANG